jgi:hypothetical protein
MAEVSFRTPKGNEIKVAIVTEEANLADHRVTNRIWDLAVSVNGRGLHWGGTKLIEDAKHGWLLKGYIGRDVIQVPAEHVDAIKALIAKYHAGREWRAAIAREADEAYEAGRRGMARVRGGALDPWADGK